MNGHLEEKQITLHITPSLPPSLPPYLHRAPGKPPTLQCLSRFLGGGGVGILDEDLPHCGGGRAGGLEGGRRGEGSEGGREEGLED